MTTQPHPGQDTVESSGQTVLLVEPDRMAGNYAAAGLSQHGYKIIRADSPDDIQRLKQDGVPIDLFVVNHAYLKIAQTLFSAGSTPSDVPVPIILLAGLPDIQVYLSQVGQEIDDIVVKPFNADQLALVVERVFLDRRMQRTLEDFKQMAIHLQEENQRLKAVLNQRIPGGVDKVLQTSTGTDETKENTRQDVLQSYAEQTHFIQPVPTKTDSSRSNKKS